MIIYLIRHAEYLSSIEWNQTEEGLRAGLSSFGKVQALAVARKLKGLGIDKVFSSTLKRADDTAKIIESHCDVPRVSDARLNEWMFARGERDRVRIKELKRRTALDRDFIPPDGESFHRVADRFTVAMRDIAESDSKRPCVVSHELIMRAFLVKTLGLKEFPALDYVSISEIVYENEKFSLGKINRQTWSLLILFEKIKRRIKDLLKKEVQC